MKQHITIKQLNELNEKGKEKLRKWAAPEGDYSMRFDEPLLLYNPQANEYNITGWSNEADNNDWIQESYPLLSIGQMIEFLDEHTKEYSHFSIRIARANRDSFSFPRWTLITLIDGLPISSIEDEPELCDALFEAVKEVLEK